MADSGIQKRTAVKTNRQTSPITLEMLMHPWIVPLPRLGKAALEIEAHNSFDSGFSGLGEY
jgi:hypothetical protein